MAENLPRSFTSLSTAGFPSKAANLLCGNHQTLFTKTHGRREVAFLNRAWDNVMTAELVLDESVQSQPLLDQSVNAKPSRCAGFDGLGMAVERFSAVLRELS